MPTDCASPVLLYDGVCGLCNRLVQFSLRHDARRQLRFAPLQSDFAGTILRRHGRDAGDLDTVYLVEKCGDPSEQLLNRSDAVIGLLRILGGGWRLTVAISRLVPRSLRDWIYGTIARNRYRMFGKNDSCFLPPADYRDRFLDH